MTPNEIYTLLKDNFAATVSFNEAQNGDPSITVLASEFHKIAQFLFVAESCKFDFLRLITGLDRGATLSSVYHLYSYTHRQQIVLRVELKKEEPRMASVSDIWPAADWLERETFDLLGIVYEGHPNLERILLPHDWVGYPLRKDYEPPSEYHGIKHD